MAKPKRTTFPGYKVIATVKSVKGNCSRGHEVDDTFSINCHDAAGLCGFFYHDMDPYITMLQFGGDFSKEWGDRGVYGPHKLSNTRASQREIKAVATNSW